jgi:hypothetical protein
VAGYRWVGRGSDVVMQADRIRLFIVGGLNVVCLELWFENLIIGSGFEYPRAHTM